MRYLVLMDFFKFVPKCSKIFYIFKCLQTTVGYHLAEKLMFRDFDF